MDKEACLVTFAHVTLTGWTECPHTARLLFEEEILRLLLQSLLTQLLFWEWRATDGTKNIGSSSGLEKMTLGGVNVVPCLDSLQKNNKKSTEKQNLQDWDTCKTFCVLFWSPFLIIFLLYRGLETNDSNSQDMGFRSPRCCTFRNISSSTTKWPYSSSALCWRRLTRCHIMMRVLSEWKGANEHSTVFVRSIDLDFKRNADGARSIIICPLVLVLDREHGFGCSNEEISKVKRILLKLHDQLSPTSFSEKSCLRKLHLSKPVQWNLVRIWNRLNSDVYIFTDQ